VEQLDKKILPPWPVPLILHFLVATIGSIMIGIVPEAIVSRFYYDTGLEAYSPAIALIALLLGYFVSFRLFGEKMASWIWLLGIAWLLFGIHSLVSTWDPRWDRVGRWQSVINNLFGKSSNCSNRECLGEFMFTTPFVSSVTYSLGAFLRSRKISGPSA
jgi:hypothetical protein